MLPRGSPVLAGGRLSLRTCPCFGCQMVCVHARAAPRQRADRRVGSHGRDGASKTDETILSWRTPSHFFSSLVLDIVATALHQLLSANTGELTGEHFDPAGGAYGAGVGHGAVQEAHDHEGLEHAAGAGALRRL